MSVAWPDSFPSPTLQNYSIAPDESIARTKMDSGVARQRRRFTSVPSKVKVRWMMNFDTFGLFEAWYRYKAKEGAEWVVMSLDNGLGFQQNDARFLKPYSAKKLSDKFWEVSANLEVREMSTLTEGALNIILELGLSIEGLQYNSNLLYNYIHVEKSGIYNW